MVVMARDYVRFKTEPLVRYTPLSQVSDRERWLIDREAWKALSQEMWYLNQEEEPSTTSGKSILVRWLSFLERKEGHCWQCCVPMQVEGWCLRTFPGSRTTDQVLEHIRDHLGLKPYPCEGACGSRIGTLENCCHRTFSAIS
jgi:hypothetical protein